MGLCSVGDAAAANDPCWGCGLSLTLRDVRVLRDALLASDDWDAACRRYAAEHDRYYGALHRITSWLRGSATLSGLRGTGCASMLCHDSPMARGRIFGSGTGLSC